MINVGKVIILEEQDVVIGVWVEDVETLGVQFKLEYNQNTLQFLNVAFPPNTFGGYNQISPNTISVAVGSNTGRTGVWCEFTFHAIGSSTLILSDVVASDLNSQDMGLDVENGYILLESAVMQVKINVSNPNPSGVGVHTLLVYEGDGPDPAINVFSMKLSLPIAPEVVFNVERNQGTKYYFVTLINAVGESPPSNVVALQTDLPQAANITIEIV